MKVLEAAPQEFAHQRRRRFVPSKLSADDVLAGVEVTDSGEFGSSDGHDEVTATPDGSIVDTRGLGNHDRVQPREFNSGADCGFDREAR
jgi:hypothetical protein